MAEQLIVGLGPGAAAGVDVLDATTGTLESSFIAFPSFTGGISVASLDVAGTTYVVAGAGSGGNGVGVFDTAGTLLNFFMPFPAGFIGGASVAAANVEGQPEIVVGAGPGGGPEVAIFNAAGTLQTAPFFAFDTVFTGGVSVGVADIGGQAEIVAGTSTEFGTVALFNNAGTELASFAPFGTSYFGGVSVGIADIGGQAEIAVAGTASTGSEVALFDVTGSVVTPQTTFEPFGTSYTGNLSVSIADVGGQAEIAVGAGSGFPPLVGVFDNNGTALVAPSYAPGEGPSFTGGVSVALETVACFRAGTRIATPCGEVAVEALSVGDLVCLARGGSARIVWVGHRTIDCARHPRPWQVWPVRIGAGALGDGRPSRELFLSPDHAVLIDGVLVPVKHLIDGEAIVQVPVEQVSYFHVELARHDVVLAEGLAVESYLDTGHRTSLHPDYVSRTWEASGCAPLVVAGPAIEAARRRSAHLTAFI